MKIVLVSVCTAMLVVLAGARPAVTAAQTPRVVTITSDDTMKFSLTTIEAKPGETLTVRLTSKGTLPKNAMGHNFVLLARGTNAEEFANAAGAARATDFIPAASKASVIANTAIAGPGETVEVTFKVPAAGVYTYLCSFTGHFAIGMKGTLVVK